MNFNSNLNPVEKGWTYEGEECGPQKWSLRNKHVYGNHQSPINIETNKAVFDEDLLKHPLTISYEINSCSEIKNTGYTFQVDAYKNNQSSIK